MIETDTELWKLITASKPIVKLGRFLVGRPLEVFDDAIGIMKDSYGNDPDMVGLIAMAVVSAGSELGRWAVSKGWRPDHAERWPEFGPYTD